MSFTVTARGKTKADVAENAELAMRDQTAKQGDHDHDRDAVSIAIRAFVRTLPEPGHGEQLVVSVSGSAATEQRELAKGVVKAVPRSTGLALSVTYEAFEEPVDGGGDGMADLSGALDVSATADEARS